MARLFSILFLIGALSGCVHYACPAPDGVTCKSISDVYQGNEQKERAGEPESFKNKPRESGSKAAFAVDPPGETPLPLRSAPKILKVWIASWIDADGDLHQDQIVYVAVDHGTWAIGQPAIDAESPSRQGPDFNQAKTPKPRSDVNGKK